MTESQQSPLERLNALSPQAAREEFYRCCGSGRWSAAMAAARPYGSMADVMIASSGVWPAMRREDWLEAFSRHPTVGDLSALRKGLDGTALWATGGQAAGTAGASEQTLRELAEAVDAYERKFGYVFIVCATDGSAEGLLRVMRSRLANPWEKELNVAAEEQKKITRARLEKMLG